MSIHVKSHRRGKSVIKAYMRAASVTSNGGASRSQFIRASNARAKLSRVIQKKVAIGNILMNREQTSSRRGDAGWIMGRLRYQATRKY